MGKIRKSIEVDAPVSACYSVWSNFERFPEFMSHVREIRRTDQPDVWHWIVDGPWGNTVEWDAVVDVLKPEELIIWHSVEHSQVDNAGEVRFQDLGNNRTKIDVRMRYDPPAGALGEFVANVFQNPETMVEEDLRNFKELLIHGRVKHRARTLNNATYNPGSRPLMP